ncbi:cytochrome P450 6B1-like [Epargyreus clarus]|uniref:cytochrome P450 6B1-like n=1 Tax=Epargyreus clarus TaxID=520877 RepID=UPI003C2E2F27
MFFESFLLNLSILGALIIALVFDYVTKFFSYWYVRHIPYKTPIPFYGSDYHRILGLRSTTDEVNKLYSRYPKDKYVGWLKSRIPDLIVKDPDALKKVLSTDFSNFHRRGTGLDKSQDVCLRNNLFHAEGEKWTLLRERLEPLLNNMNTDIQDSLRDCLSGTNGDTNVQQLLSEILDVVFTDLLLDTNADGAIIKTMRQAIQRRTTIEKVKSYLKQIFPSVYVFLGLNTLSAQLPNKIVEVLKQSKLMHEIKKVESATEIQIHENGKRKLKIESDIDFVYSHLALFVSEGYVPCQNVLTSLLYELAKEPRVQQNARDSLKCAEKYYIDWVIKETLRLHPPYSILSRVCTRTYQFPQKTLLMDKHLTVTVPIKAIHDDADYYKEPSIFNPERFSDGEISTRPEFAYIPFGGGPRKCIGEKLAMQIIRQVTEAILSQYKIEPCERTPTTLPVADHDFGRVVDRDIWLKFMPINAN